jgi:hypothetical protein
MTLAHYRYRCLFLAILLCSTFVIAWLIPPLICTSDYSICIFRTVTDKPCVFCGLTRALAYATHGDFDSAFACHKFWWLAALIIIVIVSVSMVDAVAGTSVLLRLSALRYIRVRLLACVVIMLTLVRLLFFSPI